MKQEIFRFIENNNLSPFNKLKTQLKPITSFYKTADAKKVHNKTLQIISQNFVFPDTSNLFQFFNFTNSKEEIQKRQDFFKKIFLEKEIKNDTLNKIRKTKSIWKPPYDIVVITEDAETFNELKKRNCPVQIITNEQDIVLLESREIIQIINCPEFQIALESLPQSIFLKSLDEVYLERHLENFSSYIEIINELKNQTLTNELKNLITELDSLIYLAQQKNSQTINSKEIYSKINEANIIIQEKIKKLNIQGIQLIEILSKRKFPEEIKQIIYATIKELNIPERIIEQTIPIKVDEEELEKLIQNQNTNEFSQIAEKIKENSNKLKRIPEKLKNLEKELLFFDFICGIIKFKKENYEFPKIEDELIIKNTKNIFLENPQPISFNLTNNVKASILTGANSGGKTTLIEHIIQLITLTQIGLPTSGNNTLPLFEEIYYFAKNKGSDLKGAFETLLTQMSKIKPENKTFILADEIESVTEPGVAGNIIAATTDYYVKKGCYLIIATHLGYEIQKILPEKTRIDGIEATGLTDKFELIVNHNPILGKLANSTPELIVEKMAKKENKDYFIFLNEYLKDSKHLNNKIN